MTHHHDYDYGPDHEPVDNDIPFGNRIRILSEVHERKDELADRSEGFAEFVVWADYALPLAAEIDGGDGRELSEDDYEMILEAWIEFTHLLDIDHHHAFESLDECLTASGS